MSALRLAALAQFALLGAAAPAGPVMLAPADLDPAQVLPPPPAANSAQARAELAELQATDRARRPAERAIAFHDSETKNASIFAEVLGPRFDLAQLAETARLMGIVRATEKDAADRAKAHFRRNRPWVVAPKLHHCGKDDDAAWSSYPSGHTTMGFSMGAILARLEPAKADAIMARAARYGESRIACEVHFRSDVTAGETLGLVVAERLMTKPEFQAAFAAASDELHAAGL